VSSRLADFEQASAFAFASASTFAVALVVGLGFAPPTISHARFTYRCQPHWTRIQLHDADSIQQPSRHELTHIYLNPD